MKAPFDDKLNNAALLKGYRARLRAFISRRVHLPEDSEDILQNVFYQLARADALLQPIEQVGAWLYRVARNQIIDFSRKKKEISFSEYLPNIQAKHHEADWSSDSDEIFDVLFEDTNTPEAEQLRTLFWKSLADALAELPGNQREVFEKTELQGYSFKQLAQETKLPVNTLISRKRYAVLHLRKRLQALRAEIFNY